MSEEGWVEENTQCSRHPQKTLGLCVEEIVRAMGTHVYSITKATNNAGPTATITSSHFSEKFEGFNMKLPNFFDVGSLFIIFKTLTDNSVYAKPNTCLDQMWFMTANIQPLTYTAIPHP